MAEGNEVWFCSAGIPEIEGSWVMGDEGKGLTGVSPWPPTATFAKADRGIFLAISVSIGSGNVIRFNSQTWSVSLIVWRFGLRPNILWP